MKYSVNINVCGIDDAGLSKLTDLDDWAIIDYIQGWQTVPDAKRIGLYVWINYKYLLDEIPVLNLNTKSAISNRIKKLKGLGLIETRQDKEKKIYVQITQKCANIIQFRGAPPSKKGVHTDEQGVHTDEHKAVNHLSVNHYKDIGGQNAPKPKRKNFKPPTIQEIYEYLLERGKDSMPYAHKFNDYYEARGWELGKGRKMKCWKAAVRTWLSNEYNVVQHPSSQPSELDIIEQACRNATEDYEDFGI